MCTASCSLYGVMCRWLMLHPHIKKTCSTLNVKYCKRCLACRLCHCLTVDVVVEDDHALDQSTCTAAIHSADDVALTMYIGYFPPEPSAPLVQSGCWSAAMLALRSPAPRHRGA